MFFQKKSNITDLTKRVAVYASYKHKHLILAARCQNDAGIIYEQGICYDHPLPIDMEELGIKIIEFLNLYRVIDKNLRDSKSNEWPAFKSSKSKSVRSFESEYIHISIDGSNNKNLGLIISGLPYKQSRISVVSSVSFFEDKEVIGERVMELYEACLSGKLF